MSDLTAKEQDNVRAAIRFIHARCGTWVNAAKVSASTAVRVARFAGVTVDDVLTGKYPPAGTCPHCGHCR